MVEGMVFAFFIIRIGESIKLNFTYWCHITYGSWLRLVVVLDSTQPLPKSLLTYWLCDMKIYKRNLFQVEDVCFKKMHLKMFLQITTILFRPQCLDFGGSKHRDLDLIKSQSNFHMVSIKCFWKFLLIVFCGVFFLVNLCPIVWFCRPLRRPSGIILCMCPANERQCHWPMHEIIPGPWWLMGELVMYGHVVLHY